LFDALSLRPRLFAIAYRVLGSVGDADDVVQTAYLRFEEHRNEPLRNPGGWLATVTARIAIDRARALKRERERYVGMWLPEPLVGDDCDPATETMQSDDVAMGFLRVLERLRPEERTALLLHDVFDYTHAEIAAMLCKQAQAVRKMVSRARARVRQDRPRISIQRSAAEKLTERFLSALRDGNVEELRAILATDVVAMADGGGKAYAGLRPVVGFDKVSRFMLGMQQKFWSKAELYQFVVNGLPGFGVCQNGSFRTVVAFDLKGERISCVYLVRNPEKLTHVYAPPAAPRS
jgi:RNA polymerase sigma-70 factor (ECF subfamily)